MKTLAIIIVVAFCTSGCISAMIDGSLLKLSATESAKFDTGCPSMKVVGTAYPDRYALQGCGKRVIYQCRQEVINPHGLIQHKGDAHCNQVGRF